MIRLLIVLLLTGCMQKATFIQEMEELTNYQVDIKITYPEHNDDIVVKIDDTRREITINDEVSYIKEVDDKIISVFTGDGGFYNELEVSKIPYDIDFIDLLTGGYYEDNYIYEIDDEQFLNLINDDIELVSNVILLNVIVEDNKIIKMTAEADILNGQIKYEVIFSEFDGSIRVDNITDNSGAVNDASIKAARSYITMVLSSVKTGCSTLELQNMLDSGVQVCPTNGILDLNILSDVIRINDITVIEDLIYNGNVVSGKIKYDDYIAVIKDNQIDGNLILDRN